MAVTCGLPVNGAMASAINVLDDVHGGAGQQCMELYRDDRQRPPASRRRATPRSPRASTRFIAAHGKIIPGFGHRWHPVDPRAAPLLALVERGAAAGRGQRPLCAHRRAQSKRHADARARASAIPMNIDGATAVIYCELGFAPELGRGLFILSRSVGILAHAWEQKQQGGRIKGPMPQEIPYRYTGPADARAPRRHRSRRAFASSATSTGDIMKDSFPTSWSSYLEHRGVEYMFGLCGHTNIAVLAALARSTISFVNTRHEQIAAHIADGYARAKRTDRGGALAPGPGLTNAATGVANAALDSMPMVVIAGDMPSHYYGKHPHQEVNLHADASQSEIYRPFVKRAWRVERPDLFPEIIEKAFQLAESGRPGPGAGRRADGHLLDGGRHRAVRAAAPQHASAAQAVARRGRRPRRSCTGCSAAKRPLIYAGGGVMLADAAEELRAVRRPPAAFRSRTR